jgi:hypothetical protein
MHPRRLSSQRGKSNPENVTTASKNGDKKNMNLNLLQTSWRQLNINVLFIASCTCGLSQYTVEMYLLSESMNYSLGGGLSCLTISYVKIFPK